MKAFKIVLICILSIILLALLLAHWNKQEKVIWGKYDICVDQVNKFSPNPNEIEERSELLSNCLEK